MAANDFSALRAPYTADVTLDGADETVKPPKGTRSIAWRFATTQGTVAMNGGAEVPFDEDVWFGENLRPDGAYPVDQSQNLPLVFKGTAANHLFIWFKRTAEGT